jgi:hypothetical protein
MDRDYLIGEYFKLGLKYSEIIKCLEELHGYIIGIRTLKRITKKLIHELFLGQQLIPYQDTSSATNGIRTFGHAFHIVLAQIMLSVEYKKRRLRRRVYSNKGPNSVWHIDGYDKLSRYGIKIHGCIDGFSRQIIWLKAMVSSEKLLNCFNVNVFGSHVSSYASWIHSVFPDTFYVIVSNDIWIFIKSDLSLN